MLTPRFLATTRHGLLMTALILSSVLFFSGCGKEKVLPEVAPAEVETTALTFISPIGVEVVGKITNPESSKITDHGFIYWFNKEDEISKGTKVSLPEEIESGFFTATINNIDFPEVNGAPAVFVVKAYVTDKNGTRYGEIFSKRFIGGIVSSSSPDGGKTGDVVTVDGVFRGLKASDIKITFGGVPSAIKTLTETQLTVEVPTGIPVGHGQSVNVKAVVGLVTSDISNSFKIWANIKDMNPKSGPINTKIRFTGDNLPASKNAMSVNFEPDLLFEGISGYDNGFFVGVPERIKTDKLTLSYMTGNVRAVLPWGFTVTPPVIKSVSPNPAFGMQLMTIELGNYVYLQDALNEFYVKVGNDSQWVTADESGKLIFRLDPNSDYATGSSYPVSISIGPYTVNSAAPLTFAKPAVTGFSPKRGLAGTPIHITGKFAAGATYMVNFNNIGLMFNAVSDSEIVGNVYMGMEAKTYTLSLENDAGDVPVPGGTFEVLPTKFVSVSPLSATAGTTITITGEGFYAPSLPSIVAFFAGYAAHADKVTSDKITLKLGDNTPAGTYRIKLNWDNKVYDTGLDITVLP